MFSISVLRNAHLISLTVEKSSYLPVCPYAKMQALYPWKAFSRIPSPRHLKTTSWPKKTKIKRLIFLDTFVLVTEPQSLITFSQPQKDVECIAYLLCAGLWIKSIMNAILLFILLHYNSVPGTIYHSTHCFPLRHFSRCSSFLSIVCGSYGSIIWIRFSSFSWVSMKGSFNINCLVSPPGFWASDEQEPCHPHLGMCMHLCT